MRRKLFSAFLCVLMAFAFVLSACNPQGSYDDVLPDVPEGKQQLVIYYNRPAGYENCDIWMWYSGADGRGYTFTECAYGARVVLDLPLGIDEVGFIIRTSCSNPGGTEWGEASKDGTGDDRFVMLEGERTIIYTKAGDAMSYTSEDGGKTLIALRKVNVADMLDLNRISIELSNSTNLTKDDVKITDSKGKELAIKSMSYNIATMESELDITEQYTATVLDLPPVKVLPLSYMASRAFESAYTYDGELGVELTASATTFRLWAPTASQVTLNLYDKGTGAEGKTSKELVK